MNLFLWPLGTIKSHYHTLRCVQTSSIRIRTAEWKPQVNDCWFIFEKEVLSATHFPLKYHNIYKINLFLFFLFIVLYMNTFSVHVAKYFNSLEKCWCIHMWRNWKTEWKWKKKKSIFVFNANSMGGS